MEQVVSVCRVKVTKDFVLHPFGTFKNYGGYVGIKPYRNLPSDCDATQLGAMAIELLERSGPTGFAISDIEQYRAVTVDKQSDSIHRKYFSTIRSTKDTDHRFIHCEVRAERKLKSWSIIRFAFDTAMRSMMPESTVRVRKSAGAVGLGEQLLALLQLPATKKARDR